MFTAPTSGSERVLFLKDVNVNCRIVVLMKFYFGVGTLIVQRNYRTG